MAGKNLFNSVKMTTPGRNTFDLSHDVKMSVDMGYLNPTLAMEVVPGDNISLGCESLLRFSPMLAPIMHRVNVYMHYWFVPNRITYPNWDKWISNEMPAGTVAPYIIVDGSETSAQKWFMDYMGIPPCPPGGTADGINALPFAAFQKIYNDFYRDQNLITELNIELTDGDNAVNKTMLVTSRKRAWEHDYFTSCLPWAQKGDAVDIPLGTVELIDLPITTAPGFVDLGTGVSIPNGALSASGGSGTVQSGATQGAYDPRGSLTVGATTINDLRRAFRLQEWLEKNARGGTRYAENILVHFGVKSDDARLSRPEYITGSVSPVIVSEVLQTAESFVETPLGTMAGHGISVTTGSYGSYYAKEHGYIIGIMSILPKTAYQNGIPRHYRKMEDPLNYYWPTFANIGEQAVTTNEIYAWTANKYEPWGYVPRYAEYKFLPSRVAGVFRTTLAFWHLGRIFNSEPALNQQFVECTPRNDIFAVVEAGTNQNLLCHVFHKIKASRLMPKYGNPSF